MIYLHETMTVMPAVAGGVVLASDIGSQVTGRTIFADGGMTDYPDFSHGG
jgi:enoyl-[acyl-carrier-protein] reductase (NADH)